MTNAAQAEPAFDLSSATEEAMSPEGGSPLQVSDGDSRYQAFVSDEQTRETLLGLGRNSGFNPTVHPGGIKAAIETMGGLTGVKLLIVDLSGSRAPMQDIEALADVCEAGLAVITLGEMNDIGLYRELMDAGVAEYLVKPISEHAILAAIETALTPPVEAGAAAAQQSHVSCFIASRGGVGATTVALNFAACQAAKGKGKTVLVDLDLSFGSIALALDLEPGRGLREALEAPERVDNLLLSSAAAKVSDNLFVMASEEDLGEGFRPTGEAVQFLLNLLRQEYDRVVVDLPRDLACTTPEMLASFDRVTIISDLSLMGLRDTNRMVTLFKNHVEPENLAIAANRAGQNVRAEISEREFERAIARPLAGVLPEDPKTAAILTRDARPVGDAAKGSKLDKAIRALSTRLAPKDEAENDSADKKKAKLKRERTPRKAKKDKA